MKAIVDGLNWLIGPRRAERYEERIEVLRCRHGAGRVVAAVERIREAAEVVEQRRVVPGSHAELPASLPVRGDDYNCAGVGVSFAEVEEGRGMGVAAEGGDRGTVS